MGTHTKPPSSKYCLRQYMHGHVMYYKCCTYLFLLSYHRCNNVPIIELITNTVWFLPVISDVQGDSSNHSAEKTQKTKGIFHDNFIDYYISIIQTCFNCVFYILFTTSVTIPMDGHVYNLHTQQTECFE